jgi:zinc transport system permease protein
MNELFNAISTIPLFAKATAVAMLASLACGITGTYVVKKKMTFVSGGIAHAIMGGIGIAYYLHVNTIIGALVFAVFFAGILTAAKLIAKQNEDVLIGVLWALGMAIGVLFMYMTPGYNADITSFIFGDIMLVKSSDLVAIIVLDLVLVITVIVLYYHFLYVSFDEEYLSVRGLAVNLIYFTLLLMIAVTVVILLKVVGLILVIALLTLPAVITSQFVSKMSLLIGGSVLLGLVFTGSGIIMSFFTDMPTGPTIIIVAGSSYVFSLLLKATLLKRFSRG